MKKYAPIKAKIPHPWWHWFFTQLKYYGEDGSYERHYCSKCEALYTFNAKEIKQVEIREV